MADEKKIKEQIKEEVLAKSRLWTKKNTKNVGSVLLAIRVTMSLELCSIYICN